MQSNHRHHWFICLLELFSDRWERAPFSNKVKENHMTLDSLVTMIPFFYPVDTKYLIFKTTMWGRHYYPQLTDGGNQGLEKWYGFSRVTKIHAYDIHDGELIEK